MTGQTTTSRITAHFEEELGSFRAFADLPATEIEAMAERLARVVAPFLVPAAIVPAEDRAA